LRGPATPLVEKKAMPKPTHPKPQLQLISLSASFPPIRGTLAALPCLKHTLMIINGIA
jgi:hypothetical protein